MNEMLKRIVRIAMICGTVILGGVNLSFAYTAEVSAYTHTGGVMANGEYPYVGCVAADDLPLGTNILINGRHHVVKDRFGAGYSHKIDIFMDSYDEAINFGRQSLEVTVL